VRWEKRPLTIEIRDVRLEMGETTIDNRQSTIEIKDVRLEMGETTIDH